MLVFWFYDIPAEQDRLITRMLSDNQPQSVLIRRIQGHELSALDSPLTLPLPDLLVGCLKAAENHDPFFHFLNSIRGMKSCDLMILSQDRSMSLFLRARQAGALDYALLPCTAARLRAFCAHYVNLVQQMKSTKSLTQHSIDAAYSFSQAAPSEPPTQAKLKMLRLILQTPAVSSGEPFTAQELTKELDLSRVATRRYLEDLSEMGYLTRLPELSGKVGRPKIYYKKNLQRDIQ